MIFPLLQFDNIKPEAKNIMIIAILSITFACKSNNDQEVVERIIYIDSNKIHEKHQQVTKVFGTLSVQEGEFYAKSKIVPWSSWWFPTKDKYLFENNDPEQLAPLQKYDLYVERAYGEYPGAALFEEMEIYDPSEVNWAGLCHAWAVASVLHPEPKNKLIKRKITFSIADQKALLLKSYEEVSDLEYFGDRYDGGYEDEFDDIYPEQFHRFAQVFLFDQKLPFLMDYDPSFPIWTVPIYEIKFKIEKIDQNTAHVKAWVTTASSFVEDPNFLGTKKSVKYYEYELFGYWVGANLVVTGSQWVNDAIYDHPDFLIAYPDKVKRASRNKKLDLGMINELIQ